MTPEQRKLRDAQDQVFIQELVLADCQEKAENLVEELGPEPEDREAWIHWDLETMRIEDEAGVDEARTKLHRAENACVAAYVALCEAHDVPTHIYGRDVRADIVSVANGKWPVLRDKIVEVAVNHGG